MPIEYDVATAEETPQPEVNSMPKESVFPVIFE
jgi:hypothetical protein